MGEVIQYKDYKAYDKLATFNKQQQKHFEHIEMLRVIYLFEIVSYLRNLVEYAKNDSELDLASALQDLPLVSGSHYEYILETLTLPESVLNKTDSD